MDMTPNHIPEAGGSGMYSLFGAGFGALLTALLAWMKRVRDQVEAINVVNVTAATHATRLDRLEEKMDEIHAMVYEIRGKLG